MTASISATSSPIESSETSASDHLTRVFNTALISTRAGSNGADFGEALYQLMETPAYRVLLSAVRQLSREQAVTETAAAEDLIKLFRKMDRLWEGYVLQEGLSRIVSGS